MIIANHCFQSSSYIVWPVDPLHFQCTMQSYLTAVFVMIICTFRRENIYFFALPDLILWENIYLFNKIDRISRRIQSSPFTVKNMRKNNFDFSLRTFRRVAAVTRVVHVVVGVAEDASNRFSFLEFSSFRDPSRAEQISPEVDPVLPGEAEGDDVAAGHVVDQVGEVRLAGVLRVERFGHLIKKKVI